jgi:3'(2'), 5'-bisphosphate nucleotidase
MPATRYQPFDEQLWFELLELCRRAGESIVAHYHEPELAGRLRAKADDSPLTRADLASHAILAEGLAALQPALPLLSEESDAADIAERRAWPAFWLVDPLDGTREFLERTGEFTINIALVVEHRSVAGLIYRPLQQEAYGGAVGQGARRFRWDGARWRDAAVTTRSLDPSRLVLLSSRRHRNERLQRTLDFLSARSSVERLNSGSALKFCDLAEGRGDCYPRFSPCSEWDVAAGDALVTAAGGAVLGLDGRPLAYNSRDTLLAQPFRAVGAPEAALWCELLAELGGHATERSGLVP